MEALHRLAAKSDVFISNFKVSALERLGLDGKTMLEKHPQLIYCGVSAYGATVRSLALRPFRTLTSNGIHSLTHTRTHPFAQEHKDAATRAAFGVLRQRTQRQ